MARLLLQWQGRGPLPDERAEHVAVQYAAANDTGLNEARRLVVHATAPSAQLMWRRLRWWWYLRSVTSWLAWQLWRRW